MTSYRAKANHDVALVDLTVLTPAPDEDGAARIEYTQVVSTLNGTINRQGPYVRLIWSEISSSDYNTILGVFGLTSAANANVTVYVRSETYQSWVRKNGVAQQPTDLTWNNRPRDVEILVTHLKDAA